MDNKKMTAISRLKSIQYAMNGLKTLWRTEPNARLHALATIAVIIAAYVQEIPAHSWFAVAAAICLVWITEAFNTAIEKLCDFTCKKEYHSEIKIIKDISAGAVLIATLFSIIVAILVFIIN